MKCEKCKRRIAIEEVTDYDVLTKKYKAHYYCKECSAIHRFTGELRV